MPEHLRRSGNTPTPAPGGESDRSGNTPTLAPGGESDRSGNTPTLAPIASAHGLGGSGRGTFLTVRLSEGDAIGGLSSPAVSRVDRQAARCRGNPLGDRPTAANLGWSSIVFQHPGSPGNGRHYHSFQVQEFRRPEFEVEARLESAGPHLVDEPAVAAVDAMYFSGGPLPNAEVTWTVTTRQSSYSPPNWGEFTFGVWRPWWYFGGFDEPWAEPERKTFLGRTDSSGSRRRSAASSRLTPEAATASLPTSSMMRGGPAAAS